MQYLINARIFNGSEFLPNQTVAIEHGKIKEVGKIALPTNANIFDAQDNMLLPGLIDLQIYGSGGKLFSAYPEVATLEQMDKTLYEKGTTSFLACIATNTPAVFDRCIAAAKAYRANAVGFMGLHLEGPFLNPIKRGAHIEQFIRKAKLDEVKRLLAEGDGVIKMITIAPETQDDAVLQYLLDNGVILSLGHSNASFAEATRAYDMGIQSTTHLFNAMSALQHRQPGIPVAVFNHKAAMSSIIADGHHVDFEVVAMAHRLMKERLFLITDAVTDCNTGPYQHRLNGDKYVTTDGTLSGSNITMLQAVRNCIESCRIDIVDAINMATTYPARLMGAADYGKVQSGYHARLLLTDKDLQLLKVF